MSRRTVRESQVGPERLIGDIGTGEKASLLFIYFFYFFLFFFIFFSFYIIIVVGGWREQETGKFPVTIAEENRERVANSAELA